MSFIRWSYIYKNIKRNSNTDTKDVTDLIRQFVLNAWVVKTPSFDCKRYEI